MHTYTLSGVLPSGFIWKCICDFSLIFQYLRLRKFTYIVLTNYKWGQIQELYTQKISLRIVLKHRSIRGLTRHCWWTTLKELHLRFLFHDYILLVDSRYKDIISHPDIYLFHLISIIGSWEGFSFPHIKN